MDGRSYCFKPHTHAERRVAVPYGIGYPQTLVGGDALVTPQSSGSYQALAGRCRHRPLRILFFKSTDKKQTYDITSHVCFSIFLSKITHSQREYITFAKQIYHLHEVQISHAQRAYISSSRTAYHSQPRKLAFSFTSSLVLFPKIQTNFWEPCL